MSKNNTKLDEEFKSEVNREFKQVDYIGKRIFVRILAIVLVIGVLSSVGGVFYKRWKVAQDRETFKESVTYNEAAVSFLADQYQEYNNAGTDSDRSTIMQYVVMRYPHLNTDNLDHYTLVNFYNKCLKGEK